MLYKKLKKGDKLSLAMAELEEVGDQIEVPFMYYSDASIRTAASKYNRDFAPNKVKVNRKPGGINAIVTRYE